MGSMRRDDVIWTLVVAVIAVAINPVLKLVGLLPSDVFRSLGISFPGQPQIVFGPLMAFLLLALFLKTGQAMVFPVIGFLRALALTFVFPANVERSGTLLAAFIAGAAAAMLLKNPRWAGSHVWLALLAGLYAGLYAAFNYLSIAMFGSAAQIALILAAPLRVTGIVVGSFVLGTLLGFVACRLMRPVQATVFGAPPPRYAV
jgi:energy-converting hydrogenase Eha subunit C